MRELVHLACGLVCLGSLTGPATGATLEKLSLESMSAKSTLIVRGKVASCAGESQGSLILTRCRFQVTEVWKGQNTTETSFVIPGGSYAGLVQTFVGTPKLDPDKEYVLFLWTGKSGRTQVIGLSQGVFDVAAAARGPVKVHRAASTELMLDSEGRPVQDSPVEMSVSELKVRVQRALGGAAE